MSLVDEFFEHNKNNFFRDREAVAEYVKNNCKEDVAHILRVADEVVDKTFVFDLRWDMEQTSVPVHFSGKIEWNKMPKDDPEWIFQFNRMRFWICLGQAYAMTKDEKYARAFVEQLLDWIKSVPHTTENEKCWRTIEVGIRMCNWLKAMLYFKGSEAITDDVMKCFVASLTEHAEFIMSVWNSYNLMSNWGVMANHGLFMAGMMLPPTERTAEYRKTSISRLAKELEIQIYSDGAQWEQSPMYHNEVLRDFLDVALLAHRNGIYLSFYPTLQKMIDASIAYQKPNGRELCFGDSDDIDSRDVITTAAVVAEYYAGGLSRYKAAGYDKMDFESAWDTGEMLRYNETSAREDFHAVQLPASGNYFITNPLRPFSDSERTYLHFHCGTLGAGHGHSDQLHISLFANGEDVLIDSGRFTYVYQHGEREEFKDSTAHNTCIVDGKNFYKCEDSWLCSKLAKNVNRYCVENLYIEGGHLGYIDITDGGVFVNRRVIALDAKKTLFLVCDEFYTGSKHEYSQFWHFNNAGNLSETSSNTFRYTSKKNDTEVLTLRGANVVDLTQKITNTRFSLHYNRSEANKTLVTSWKSDEFTSLYTVISLNPAGFFKHASIKSLSVYSNFKHIVFSPQQIEAIEIERGEEKYTAVIAHTEYASPTDTFCVGGEGLHTDCFQTSKGGLTGFGEVVLFNNDGSVNRIKE